jgi:hypothetical protein
MITEFDQLKEYILNNVRTFNFLDEHDFIYNTLRDMPDDVVNDTNVVEIGSYCGASTLSLFLGAMKHTGSRIVCLDPFDLFLKRPDLCDRTMGVLDIFKNWFVNVYNAGYWETGRIIPMIGFSQAILPLLSGDISFAWIDGNHNKDFTKMDIINVDKKSKVGTVIACHDYGFCSDVVVAVNETLARWKDRYEQIHKTDYVISDKLDSSVFDVGIGGGSKGTWSPGMIAFRRIA